MIGLRSNIKYSVIVPTRNRADILERCLLCLSELNPPLQGWEVLVVDNGSTDSTKDVVERFVGKITNLQYYFESRPGLMMGRHLGCETARGDILCYIDDDSFVDKQWLAGIEKAFSDPKVVLVGGPNIPEYEVKPPLWMDGFWRKIEYGVLNGWLSLVNFGNQEIKISPRFVYGCNFNIRKNIFIELGGSHPDCIPKSLQRFQGDGETGLSDKLISLGYSALYSPEVKVNHFIQASRLTLEYFCERAYYQGVSDSFTQIRREHRIDCMRDAVIPNERANLLWINKIKKGYQLLSERIYHSLILMKLKIMNHQKDYLKIRTVADKSYEEGKAFHRKEVESDPALLEYVLRENFMGKNGEMPCPSQII